MGSNPRPFRFAGTNATGTGARRATICRSNIAKVRTKALNLGVY